MNAVATAHAETDAFMQSVAEKTAALGKPITCQGVGCYHCCKELVFIERREALHMLEDLSATEREYLTRVTQRWWDRFFAAGLHLAPYVPNEPGYAKLLFYRTQNLWCPFLKNGACSQYSKRPYGCRVHVAIGNPTRCSHDGLRRKQQFVMGEVGADMARRHLSLMTSGELTPTIEYDHLGIWLGHLLLGKTERSKAGQSIQVHA